MFALNKQLSRFLRDHAVLLEVAGENVFRVRAYERAARSIESLGEDIASVARAGALRRIPGIGKELSAHISEYLVSGRVASFAAVEKKVPLGVLQVLRIPSVGPKTARLFYEAAGVRSVEDLEKKLRTGALVKLPGIREKTLENIRQGIRIFRAGSARMTLREALETARQFGTPLSRGKLARRISVAGSLRRHKETVRDIDILLACAQHERVAGFMRSHPLTEELIEAGKTKIAVRTRDGVRVDCRIVPDRSFGAALIYFTGSKEFNIELRQLAIKRGFKLNEYGLFDRRGRYRAGADEEELFALLGLPFIAPELREGTGEIDAALNGTLPDLVGIKDIRGDLHVHSTWSDGNSTIREMAAAAGALGYDYVAVTDHSQSLKIARGLNRRRLQQKRAEVDRINAEGGFPAVLFGTEVDIMPDGSIDYPPDILRQFDVVVAAVHTAFKQGSSAMTKRLVNACRNPQVHIIAHPSSSLWGVREPSEFDFNALLRAAADTNTHLEINSSPERLDLNGTCARTAVEGGVRVAINTDAHHAEHLGYMQMGVWTAMRGWLRAEQVVNTRPLSQLRSLLKK